MSQNDMVIANQTFPSFRADVNGALQALASTSKGNTRPSTVYAGQLWIDDNSPSTSLWTLYVYDGTADLPLGLLDTVNHVFIPLLNPFAGASSGTNTITLSLSPAPAPAAYYTGALYTFIATNANTGAATANIDGLGAKDITKRGATPLAAGDIPAGMLCIMQYDGTRMQLINPAVPAFFSGAVVQSASAGYATYGTLTTQIPSDNTIPQITEGTEILTVTITPKYADSNLRIKWEGYGTLSGAASIVSALFRDSTANALKATLTGANALYPALAGDYAEVAAGSTSATTFRLRVGPNAAVNLYLNGDTTSRLFGGVAGWRMIVEEVRP